MRFLLLVLFAVAAACTSGPRAPKEKEARATLVFVSDLWGQLEPCGCSEDMKGGLDRMASRLEALRKQGPVLLVDAGGSLFDQGAYRDEEEVQARLRADAVVRALLGMGLDAKVVGERDGILSRETPWFPQEIIVGAPALREVGGIRVGLLPLGDEPVPAKVEGEAAGLRRAGADLVVAIAPVGRVGVSRLALPGLDLVVVSGMATIPEGDREIQLLGKPPVLAPLGRGQGLLEVELVLRGRREPFQVQNGAGAEGEIRSLDERIRSYEERAAALEGEGAATFLQKAAELRERRREIASRDEALPTEGNVLSHRFSTIDGELPSHPGARRILRAYDREVAKANLAYAQAHPKVCPEPQGGEATFVGQGACASCHPAAQAFWATTSHGKAYATLEKAHKQFDLSCVSCHVTGWDRPGGPCSVAAVEGRKDVGCESCHGPGSLHAQAPSRSNIAAAVPEATCRSCHTPDHSLGFDPATYLRKILGPGHGEKALQGIGASEP